MSKIADFLPELDEKELDFVSSAVKNLPDDRLDEFAKMYKSQRKKPVIILLTTLLGFIGIAGIQRFILGQAGMGLLYFFTGGIFFIGTIVDVFKFKQLTYPLNEELAFRIARRLG